MRRRLARALEVAAAAAGRVLRFSPGLAGPALVAVGVGWIYLPAGLIVGGLILWLADWRMT